MDEGEDGSRGPDFGVVGSGGFKLGQGENAIANRTGADEEAAHFSWELATYHALPRRRSILSKDSSGAMSLTIT